MEVGHRHQTAGGPAAGERSEAALSEGRARGRCSQVPNLTNLGELFRVGASRGEVKRAGRGVVEYSSARGSAVWHIALTEDVVVRAPGSGAPSVSWERRRRSSL